MAGAPLKRQKVERTAAFLAEPEALTIICDFVSEKTLAEFCSSNDYRYKQVRDWLFANEERAKAYASGLEARDSYYTDRVQQIVRDVADVDVRKMYDANGKLLDVKDLPPEVARSVQAFDESYNEETGTLTKKLKLNDRLRGADMLGKSVGMFKDRVEVTGAKGGPIQTEELSMNEAARRIAFVLTKASKQQQPAKRSDES